MDYRSTERLCEAALFCAQLRLERNDNICLLVRSQSQCNHHAAVCKRSPSVFSASACRSLLFTTYCKVRLRGGAKMGQVIRCFVTKITNKKWSDSTIKVRRASDLVQLIIIFCRYFTENYKIKIHSTPNFPIYPITIKATMSKNENSLHCQLCTADFKTKSSQEKEKGKCGEEKTTRKRTQNREREIGK